MDSKLKPPFRADVVGSYLRPECLKEAREKYAKGIISREELIAVEDETITDLIRKQKEAGLHTITDGEFRRRWWHNDFFWGLEGVGKVVYKLEAGGQIVGTDTITEMEHVELTGRLGGKNHPFIEHFKFVKQFEDEEHIAKLTIPSPAQFLTALHMGENPKHIEDFYASNDELLEGIILAYQEFIEEVYDAGCRYLQFDDPSWGRLCNKRWRDKPMEVIRICKEKLKVNNGAMQKKPDDLTITTHVCRGNFRSTWMSSGGYAPVAPYIFAKEDVDGFFLEYDTERAGGFEPLEYIAPGKKVVLGLVTSKFPELEDKEEIKKRIQEAAQYVPLENLCLSPQCGFASTEEGNIMTEEEQWAKIRHVVKIAEEVWG